MSSQSQVNRAAAQGAVSSNGTSSSRVASRDTVSAPLRTIQVERVRISEQQQSSVSEAINAGRKAAGKS